MIIRYGVISATKKGFAKVHFEEDAIVTDWLPVVVRKSKSDKESWQLETNEHVVCLMDEQCETGVIIGAIHNDQDAPDTGEAAGKFRKLFSDGTLIEYDKTAHKLTVDVKGQLQAKTTGKAAIEAGTELEATATVKAAVLAPIIEIKGVATVTVEALAINLTGNVVVSGSLVAASIATSAGGSISAGAGNIETTGELKGGTVKAGTVDLGMHTHSGVQTGGGASGPPIP